MSARPRVEVDGRLDRAVDASVLGRLGSAVFEPWLRERRWFGGKGRGATGVRLRDVVPLYRDDPASAVARLVVDSPDAPPATYQVPLAVRGKAPPGVVAPLAQVRAPDGDGVLFDALEDRVFRERLGRSFAEGATFADAGARWVVSAVDDTGRHAIPAGIETALGRAEQSNTSVVFGETAILKLFRRLEPGEHPDTEIGRFLATRTSFRNVPRLFGTIRFEDGDGTTTVAGQLQAFVPGSRDGWSHALARLRDELDGRDTDAFTPEARRLGEITRGLHDALASVPDDPAFAPEPVTPADLARWAGAVRSQADRALRLLPASSAAEAAGAATLARRESIAALVDDLVERASGDPGARIRHHGDYHLGQVLRTTAGDFMIIDFEGEPARPLAERREKHSALRDVAGMLRSLDYAAGAVSRERDAVRPAADAWRERARAAFLEGYRAAGPSAILPREEGAFAALLSLFEVEKVLYELAYELDNRPDWVVIPLGGLRAVFERAARR